MQARPGGYADPAPEAPPRWLPIAEILTVLAAAAMGLWAVRPLLEEWGLFLAFRGSGLSYMASIFPLIAMRPLHLVPSALQWLAGGGAPWGVGIVAALLMVARYLAARWAVAPVLAPVQRWAFATAGMLLIGWPALWLARFHPAQLSATLYLVLLGLSIRLSIRNTVLPYLFGALCLCGLLMVYQALALLVLLLPVLAFLWVPPGQRADAASRLGRGLRSLAMVAAGFAVYGIYVLVIYLAMSGIYEMAVVAGFGQGGLVATLLGNVALAYGSLYASSPLTLGLLLALLCFATSTGGSRRGAWPIILAVLAVLCLPFLSLTFLSPSHLRDPERAMLPVACGTVTVLLGLLMGRSERNDDLQGIALVAALLFSALALAQGTRARWEVQKDVATQVANLVLRTGARHVVLRDETGRLGDVYSFLANTMDEALAMRGIDARVSLCTPEGVDRLHPDARRYPIETTPRCAVGGRGGEELDATARMLGGRIVIGPTGPR